MKSKTVLASLFVLVVLFVPSSAFPQGENPPPPCCNRDGGAPEMLPDPGVNAAPDQGIQVTVSDAALQDMGMSRTDFINRLAESVYPARSVDLMIPTTSLLSPGSAEGGRGRLPGDVRLDLFGNQVFGEKLIAVQVKRLYQVPRALVGEETIKKADQIYITDGRTYMEVRFSTKQ